MSQGAQDADYEAAQLMGELEKATSAVRLVEDLAQKKKAEREARVVYKKAKTAINTLRRETNSIDDVTQKSVYQHKYTQFDEQLKRFDNELKTLIKPAKKRPATSGQREMDNIMGDGQFDSAGQALTAANRAQDDNLQRLARIERTAATTEDMGNEIAQTVQQQTETIRNIDKELVTLQSQIDRAKEDVKWFVRQMSSDKCFLCIMALIIMSLVLLTFWKIYDGRKNKDSPPPPPTRASEGTGTTVVINNPTAAAPAPTAATAAATAATAATAAVTAPPPTAATAPPATTLAAATTAAATTLAAPVTTVAAVPTTAATAAATTVAAATTTVAAAPATTAGPTRAAVARLVGRIQSRRRLA